VADDDGWSPLLVALVRVAVGSAVLVAVLLLRRDRFPRGARTWGHLAVAGALFNAIPFTLFAFSETRISSVLAGIWNATTPLNTLLVALVVLPEERPNRSRVLGLAVGFAGVVLVLGPWHGLGGRSLVGNLAAFGAAACYGLGFPYTRRYLAGRSESGVSLSAAQMLLATLQLALVAPWLASGPAAWRARSLLSLLALGALGTGVAYILNYRVIRAAGATVASTVTYLIPLFSTALGIIVLGERLSWNQPVGAVAVLGGVAISQSLLRGGRRARRAPK
jgi:drug/metabolite transporter (DMT)-like permease